MVITNFSRSYNYYNSSKLFSKSTTASDSFEISVTARQDQNQSSEPSALVSQLSQRRIADRVRFPAAASFVSATNGANPAESRLGPAALSKNYLPRAALRRRNRRGAARYPVYNRPIRSGYYLGSIQHRGRRLGRAHALQSSHMHICTLNS